MQQQNLIRAYCSFICILQLKHQARFFLQGALSFNRILCRLKLTLNQANTRRNSNHNVNTLVFDHLNEFVTRKKQLRFDFELVIFIFS
jgi:hypothetical protein